MADRLCEEIDRWLPLLEKITEEQASGKRADGGWSAKEVVGHLIDSACNNHQKWIRAAQLPGSKFPGYDADFWVARSDWRKHEWADLLELLEAYQWALVEVASSMPKEWWSNELEIVGSYRATLGYMMDDYVEHFNHHLSEVFSRNFSTK